MIHLSKLLLDQVSSGDALRYGEKVTGHAAQIGTVPTAAPRSASARRPVVVWNLTRSCNLRCIHCYTDSEAKKYSGELSSEESRSVVDDLAAFGVPAVLLSGGEPLVRHDFWDLSAYARSKGLRLTLSTNGTLIDKPTAQRLKDVGFSYIGISLDGIGPTNDHFRGKEGAFQAAVQAFRNCKAVGQRVGLRLTLTRHNAKDLPKIFEFLEAEGIERACFYHLVYSGRGREISDSDLTHAETRQAIDFLIERTLSDATKGAAREILTVDNHIDGVYLYMKTLERDPVRAEEIAKLLQWNGGGRNSSGVGIADIDFLGNVHADQFWQDYSFGNVRERPFSKIWTDLSDDLLRGLRDQQGRIQGKCSVCKWYDMCGGGLRVRAQRVYGTPWAPDPACYLTNEECGISTADVEALKARGRWFAPLAHLSEPRADNPAGPAPEENPASVPA